VALDLKQAIAQYGTLGILANSIPDLRAKLEQGAKDEWTPDRFWAEIQQTHWWTSTSETRRQAQILEKTDPGTWKRNLELAAGKVATMATELGVTLGKGQATSLANHALRTGITDDILKNMVGGLGAGGTGGSYKGAAADIDAQIRQAYSVQGVGFTDAAIRRSVNDVIAGKSTLATYENFARQQAKSRYPNLGEQLDSGMTVKDVASPYVAQMAQTLELDENAIDLSDSHIKRALTDRDEKGVPRTQPLWQFERQLKDDPRWDKTQGAHNQTYDMLARIGQDWGFSS
jgi:hypothetical protein